MNKAVWDFIEGLLMSCFSAWILKEYLDTFLIKIKMNWKIIAIWGFFILWQICSTLNIIKLPDYDILVLSVLAVLLVSLNYEGRIFRKTVFTLVYNSIWMLTEILLVFIFIAIGLDYDTQELLGSLLSKVFLFVIVEALKHFFGNEKIKELPRSYNMILVLIPLGSMFVVYTSFFMSANSQKSFSVLWSFASLVIMLFINILIFTIYLKLSEDMELREKNGKRLNFGR